MQLLKKLKTKSILKTLLPALCLILVACLLLAGSNVWLLFQKPANLFDVPREELEGKYVTIDLEYIYGSYAYTEEYEGNAATGNITSVEYVIDANYYDFCGLLLKDDKLIEQADELADQSEALDNLVIDEVTAAFTVTGIMERMPDDSLEFYHEAVGYEDIVSEEEDIFLPLYLVARSGADNITSVVLAILAAVLLVIALVMLLGAFTGSHQKQLRKKAKALSPNNPDIILEQVQELYESQPESKNLKIDSRLLFAQSGTKSMLFETRELVWAYHAITTHRVYFIPVGKTHALALGMLDGTKLTIPMKEKQVKQWLESIHNLHPECILGYNEPIAKAFKKNPASLLQSGEPVEE